MIPRRPARWSWSVLGGVVRGVGYALVVVVATAAIAWPVRLRSIAMRYPNAPLPEPDWLARHRVTSPLWNSIDIDENRVLESGLPTTDDVFKRLNVPASRCFFVEGPRRPGPPPPYDFSDREYVVWRQSWLTE